MDDYEAIQRLGGWTGLQAIDDAIARQRGVPNFFMAIPRLLRVEGVHTDILAWLLEPTAWHGLGDRFARGLAAAVIGQCGHPASAIRVEYVEREASTGRGTIDLLLRGLADGIPFVLGIENKVDAPESEDQLHKYGEGLRQLYPDRLLMLVLLSPDVRHPHREPTCPHVTMTYTGLAEVLGESLGSPTPPDREPLISTGHTLTSHYLAALRTTLMPNTTPEIDALCRELYLKHSQAWRAIRKRLPSERDEQHYRLAEAVCAKLTATGQGEWEHSVRRDLYVRLFRPAWRCLGEREAHPLVGIGPESPRLMYPQLHFRLVAEPTDDGRVNYAVRLTAPPSRTMPDAAKVAAALRPLAQKDVAPHAQFTIRFKTSKRLPVLKDDSPVPDDVVDFCVREMKKAIDIIDGALSS